MTTKLFGARSALVAAGLGALVAFSPSVAWSQLNPDLSPPPTTLEERNASPNVLQGNQEVIERPSDQYLQQQRDARREAELNAQIEGSRLNAQPNNPQGNLNAAANNDVTTNMEVLARGPVHEAFAEAYVTNPQQPQAVPREAPALIDEVPPDAMPEGENVQWIPGYWAWDDQRSDFIWISGLWRDIPPGQRWVPGSWVTDGGQSRWVAGFWTSARTNRIDYLPQPPESLEQGPNIASPGDNHFWVPGSWVYQSNDYRWVPGYWAPGRPNWVWVPARYYWTPRGYIYTAGYWDYPPTYRATVFAPVYFPNYRVPRYQPSYVVPVNRLLTHFFVRPGFNSYYFGNYYGDQFVSSGYYPWVNAGIYQNTGGYYYDPLWSYFSYSGNGQILNRLMGWNQYYQYNAAVRPGLTLVDIQRQGIGGGLNNNAVITGDDTQLAAQQSMLLTSLSDITSDTSTAGRFGRFRNLEADTRRNVERSVGQLRELQQNRARVAANAEIQGGAAAGRGGANVEAGAGLQLPATGDAANNPLAPGDVDQAQQPGRLPEPPTTSPVDRLRERGEARPDLTPNPDRNPDLTSDPNTNRVNPNVDSRLNDLVPDRVPDLPENVRPEADQQRQRFQELLRRNGMRDNQLGNQPGAGRGPNRGNSPGQQPRELNDALQPPASENAGRGAGRNPLQPGGNNPGANNPGANPLNPGGNAPGRNPMQPGANNPGVNPINPGANNPGANPLNPGANAPGRNPGQPGANNPGAVNPGGNVPGRNPVQPPGRNPAQPPGRNPGAANPPGVNNPVPPVGGVNPPGVNNPVPPAGGANPPGRGAANPIPPVGGVPGGGAVNPPSTGAPPIVPPTGGNGLAPNRPGANPGSGLSPGTGPNSGVPAQPINLPPGVTPPNRGG